MFETKNKSNNYISQIYTLNQNVLGFVVIFEISKIDLTVNKYSSA